MVKLQDKDKMEQEVKQTENVMTAEVTRQVMNHAMSTAVTKCLRLCTGVTPLCRDTLRKLKPRRIHHWNYVSHSN
jgi:hypothetical protein